MSRFVSHPGWLQNWFSRRISQPSGSSLYSVISLENLACETSSSKCSLISTPRCYSSLVRREINVAKCRCLFPYLQGVFVLYLLSDLIMVLFSLCKYLLHPSLQFGRYALPAELLLNTSPPVLSTFQVDYYRFSRRNSCIADH